jgi:hypothetical protein
MKHLIIISIIILSFFTGLYTGTVFMLPRHEIQQIGEINPKITLVSFDKIESGQLIGHIEGHQARLKTRNHVAVPAIDDTFRINLSDLGIFPEDVEPIDIPDGAEFVASKNGQKIYSLTSKAGQKINPKNRIYFSSVYEAMSQGYRK